MGNCIAEAIDDFGPDFDAEGNPIEEGESDRVTSREERERKASSDEVVADEADDEDEDGDDAGAKSQQDDEDEEPGKEKDAEAATA